MKKVTQKALSLFLSFAMLFGMVQGVGSVTAFADSGVTAYYCDSGLYQDSNYTTPFSGDNSTITNIKIKDGTQDIGNDTFRGYANLTDVSIPDTVKTIGGAAFYGCSKLQTVTFEGKSKLTTLEANLFNGCGSLSSITIPDTVQSIGQDAFHGCTGLKSVTIPGSVRSIVSYAFYGSGLTEISIPDGVETIGGDAFANCGSLVSATIPDSVTSINGGAFYGCGALQTVTFEGKSQLTTIESDLFHDCASLSSITIPDTVQSIGQNAFHGCTGLSSVKIPDSVRSIDRDAFSGSGLTGISIPDGVETIGGAAFYSCTSLEAAALPANSNFTSIAANLFDGCTSLKSISIPSTVKTIGDHAFSNCTALTSVSIPNGVTSIGEYAFEGSILTRVTIPASVTSIGKNAFQGCAKLTGVILKGTTPPKTIGNYAFDEANATVTFLVPTGAVGAYQVVLNADVTSSSTANVVEEKDVTAISGLPAAKTVANGTAQDALNLPQTLTVTVNGSPTETPVVWTSAPSYDPSQAGTYTFTPGLTLEKGYLLDDGVVDTVSVAVQAPAPVVSGVTVTPSTASTQRGASQQFTAVVEGTNSPSQNVTWNVTGNNSTGTTIDQSGKLTVAADETAATLTVKAASVSDTGKFGTAVVTVIGSDNSSSSSGDHHSSSSSLTPSLPSAVTDSPSGAQVVLSGATLPSSVTGVSLSVTPETSTGAPQGVSGGTSDPQGAAAYNFAISDTALNIIGTPLLYNIKLLDQNGNSASFTGSVTVRIPVPAGIHGIPHVYRYESDGTLTDLGATVQGGYLVFTTTHFSYYVVAGTGDSITLDTKSYQMLVGGKYQVGAKLTGSKAATVKVYSTSEKTATVAKLKSGNYQVTGKGVGTAYIMFDVYDNKNHLLTHASTRIDVKTGIRPRGDSTRQIGVF